MNYSIIIDEEFNKEFKLLLKKFPSLKTDFKHLIENLEKELSLADNLGNGFKKIRINIKSKGKGKSGGGRIITYETVIAINETSITFLSIYNKGDFDTIDINLLKKNLRL